MAVFRPFTSEVIVAKVKSSDEDGIRRMSLITKPLFFEPPIPFSNCRILRRHIHPSILPPPTNSIVRSSPDFHYQPLHALPHSDPNERAHFWLPDSELTSIHDMLDTPVAERMYIDQGEVVRVRVEADDFYDDEPGPPKMAEGVQIKSEAKRAPYNIIVCFCSLPCLF